LVLEFGTPDQWTGRAGCDAAVSFVSYLTLFRVFESLDSVKEIAQLCLLLRSYACYAILALHNLLLIKELDSPSVLFCFVFVFGWFVLFLFVFCFFCSIFGSSLITNCSYPAIFASSRC
jgi:hypothetical protein